MKMLLIVAAVLAFAGCTTAKAPPDGDPMKSGKTGAVSSPPYGPPASPR